ncbi:MAG: hypothetical protein AAF990_28090, partial [Bacteroidota bacterium]
MKYLSFLLCLALFTACSFDNNQLQKAHERFIEKIDNNQYEKAAKRVDKLSVEYLSQLRDHLQASDARKAYDLGMAFDCPLSTLLIYESLQEAFQTEGATFSMEDMLMYLSMVEIGILGPHRSARFRFQEVAFSDDQSAAVKVLMSTGNDNSFIGTKHFYNKEGGRWKISIPSTFLVEEKIFKQLHRRSGMDEMAFMEEHVKAGRQDIEFRYRIPR